MTANFSRRSFVALASVLPFALRSLAESVEAGPRWIFLGTDQGKGIYRATWNDGTGELGKVELAIEADRADFFAVKSKHSKQPFLYSVNSVGNRKGAVSSYRVDAATGGLTFLNRVSSHGDGPCFVSLNTWGDSAFVANYSGGSFAAYRIKGNGKLSTGNGVLNCHENTACGSLGPVKDRQDAAHLHCATISPEGNFVLVCDLGDDSIEVIPIHPGGKQMLGTPMRVDARTGSGPRHLAFDAYGKWVYCIHELDCTIDVYDWSVHHNKVTMTLREDSVISTLSKGVALADNTACEIVVGDDGRFVYACTRGVDEITVYRVDRATGSLTEQQRLSCGGKVPRYIGFDPSRRWLVCCNQGAPGSVTVFAHEARTGKLTGPVQTVVADTPMFVQFV